MTANSVSIGILGATGYTGVELLRLVQDHPSVRVACMTSERHAGQPIAAVFPHLAGRPLPVLSRIEDCDPGALDVLFGCLPHGTTQDVVRELPRGAKVVDLSADFRLRDPVALRAHLRPAAPGDRAPEGGGLRPHRVRPRRAPGDRSGGDPRLLPDHRPAAAEAAARGGADRARPDHHRCQVGGHRRRAHRQGSLAAQRGERGPARLRGRQPSPRAGDRAGPVRLGGPAGRGDLHAASGADEPRHPGDDLCPPRRRRRGRGSAGGARAALRGRALRRACCRSRACPRPATCAAPISA